MKNGKIVPEKTDTAFDLDDDLDLADFTLDMQPMEDDRKPITKFKDGFISGAKDGLKDTYFIKNSMRQILPEGFGKTMDLADTLASNTRTLYDDTAKEIKPFIKDAKRIAAKLIPRESKLVPKSVKEALARWEEEAKTAYSGPMSKEAQRENFLAIQMADTFKVQTDLQVQERAEDQAKDSIRQGLEISRHRDIFGILNQSNMHLSRLSQFETTVGLNIKKKSLELQYRQLFATQDIVQESRESNLVIKDSLARILKNTGLPDFVKINDSEHRNLIFKNKFYESMQRGIFGGRDQFVEKLFGNIKNNILGKVKEQVSNARMGLMGAEEVSDAVRDATGDGEGPGGPNVHELGGNIVGDAVAKSLAFRGAKWARNKLKTSAPNANLWLENKGKDYLYNAENFDHKLNTFKNSDIGENSDNDSVFNSVKSSIFKFAKSIIPGSGVDDSTDTTAMSDMNSPYAWTRRADKSLTEIIPGYLSRILREIQVFRTGNEKIELTDYDYDKNSFTGRDVLKKAVYDKLVNPKSVVNAQERMDALLKQIDPDGTKLSDSARDALKEKLFKSSSSGQEASRENFTKYYSYGQGKDQEEEEIIPLMKAFFDNQDRKSKVEFARMYRALSEGIYDSRGTAQDYINNGKSDVLKELGFLNEKGNEFNIEKVLKHHITGRASVDGQRAAGGPVQAGKNYIVGERGIEILHTGDTPGTIIPNHKLQNPFLRGPTTSKPGEYQHASLSTAGEAPPKDNQSTLDKILEQHIIKIIESLQTTNAHVKNIEEMVKAGLSINITKNHYSFSNLDTDKLKDIPGLGIQKLKAFINAARESKAAKSAGEKARKVYDKARNSKIRDSDFIASAEDRLTEVLKGLKDAQERFMEQARSQRFDSSVPGIAASIAHRGASAIGTGAKFLRAAFKSNWKYGGQHLSAIKDKAMQWWDNDVYDVYVEGDERPRLTATNIVAGKYSGVTTGRVIYSSKDVTEPIVGPDGRLLISEDDLKNLYIYDPKTRAMRALKTSSSFIKKAASLAVNFTKTKGLDIFNQQLEVAKRVRQMAGAAASKVFEFGMTLIDEPCDIYLPGERDPRLLGRVMRNGGYTSKTSGNKILRPSQIDGPVLDSEGQVILTLDDLRKGLLDFNGKAIKTPLQKIKSGLAGVIGAGLRLQKWGFNVTKDLLTKGINKVKGLFGDFSIEINSKKTVTVLEQIRDILLDKFGKKSHVIGDSDGDGVREGSWQDRRAKAKAKAESDRNRQNGTRDDRAKSRSDASGAGLMGGLGGMLGGLLDGIKSAVETLSDLKGLFGGKGKIAAGAATTAGAAAGGAARAGGIGSKILGAGRAVGSGLWTAGKYGLAAIPFLGSGAAAAATTVAGSGLSLVGTTLAALGGSLLAFVSSPVVLGVAATALLGYGAYKGYRYLTKGSCTPLEKIRYVQYGFKPEDMRHASKITQFEKYINSFVKTDSSGAYIEDKSLDAEKMMSPFGLDNTDKDQAEKFFRWYQNRFKPVFLTHVTALNAIGKKTNLSEADSLEDIDKKAYVEATKFPDGPYNVSYLPLGDEYKDVQASDGKDVKSTIEMVIKELKLDNLKKTTKLRSGVAEIATTTAMANKPIAVTDNNKPNLMSKAAIEEAAAVVAKTKTGQMPLTGSGASLKMTVDTDNELDQIRGRVNALDAVRYKAYGLSELDPSKVRALKLLEKEIVRNIKYQRFSSVTWEGDSVLILDQVAGSFGVPGVASKEGKNWISWFNNRFLPLFITYISGYKNVVGKPYSDMGLLALTASQTLDIAKLISGKNGVWNQSESPWPGYELNSDPSTTRENIASLEEGAKQASLEEERKSIVNKATLDSSKKTDEKVTPNSAANNLPTSSPTKTSVGNNPATQNPDAEERKPSSSPASSGSNKSPSTSGVVLAGGEIKDGRNGINYVQLNSDVSLKNQNPTMVKNFMGMAEEYGTITGKKVPVTDGFRTYAQQAALYAKNPSKAAKPGNSMHEYGLAMDVDSKTLDSMDQMGLMRKYGFTRPVGQEPWHMEPAGIQADQDAAKKDPNAASDWIDSGLGRGGGGYGTISDAPKLSRNKEYQSKLFNMSVPPTTVAATAPDGSTTVVKSTNKNKITDAISAINKTAEVVPAKGSAGIKKPFEKDDKSSDSIKAVAATSDGEIQTQASSKPPTADQKKEISPVVASVIPTKSQSPTQPAPNKGLMKSFEVNTNNPPEVTRQAKYTSNPLNSAYGLDIMSSENRSQSKVQSDINVDMMKMTESLLSESLSVEKKIYEVLLKIHDTVKSTKQVDSKTQEVMKATPAKEEPYTYKPPTPAVSMRNKIS